MMKKNSRRDHSTILLGKKEAVGSAECSTVGEQTILPAKGLVEGRLLIL